MKCTEMENLQPEIKLYLDTKTEYEPKRSKDGWNLGTIQKDVR